MWFKNIQLHSFSASELSVPCFRIVCLLPPNLQFDRIRFGRKPWERQKKNAHVINTFSLVMTNERKSKRSTRVWGVSVQCKICFDYIRTTHGCLQCIQNALYMLRICQSYHTVVSFTLAPLNLYVGSYHRVRAHTSSTTAHMRYKYQHNYMTLTLYKKRSTQWKKCQRLWKPWIQPKISIHLHRL